MTDTTGNTATRMRLGYRLTCILAKTIFRVIWGLKIRGRENIPKSGPFILASNHKSGFDPPIVGGCCPREVHFAAKKELFKTPVIGPWITYLNSIPVKRSGFDREALVRLGDALEKGGAIIMFPEGTRHLDDRLHPPKAGIGMIALKYNAPIVPAYIQNSVCIRKQVLHRNLTLTYGKPFTVADLGELPAGKEAYQYIANEVMKRIAEVGRVEPPVDVMELAEVE